MDKYPDFIFFQDQQIAMACQLEFIRETNANGVMIHLLEDLKRFPMFEHCQHDNMENVIWFSTDGIM